DTARRKRQKQQQKQELTQIVRTEQAAERRVNPDAVKFPRAAAAEQALLGVLLLHPDTLEDTVAALPPTEIVTALHRGIYEALCERQRQGLVCDIGLLSQALDEIQMAVLSKALSDAKERGAEPADAAKYAEVIRSEKRLTALTSPGGVSDEEIQGLLEAMRKEKK
ncbi:MAG: hypothetical protein FWF49_05800, partial [Oscillospiraceae bacterium]|nr:hypothetical protein [Oscillospiraceae bacterium]